MERQALQEAEQGPAALAELRANGLSEQDARAALSACHGNIDKVLCCAVPCCAMCYSLEGC